MIEVRSATKKEGKISGIEKLKACTSRLSLGSL